MQHYIDSLLKFLQPLLGFANCHMVDFFTHSAYKNFIPLEIQSELRSKNSDFIFRNDFSDTPNLRKFVESCQSFTAKNSQVCLDLQAFMQTLGCDSDRFRLEMFMSAKKSHEVEVLSAVAASVATLCETSHLVDIGDGKGYLSSMLALHHQIAVLGIDASNVNTCGAIKRATKLSKIWNSIPSNPRKSHPKKNENFTNANVALYKQATQFVDDDLDLEKMISDHFGPTSPVHLGLVGLHTCGDLSPNCLTIFCKNPSVRSICNVGCCYHLLREGHSFPLSRHLMEKNVTIGRSARMIANQSIDRILTYKELPNITIFYRALLQVVLVQHCSQLPTKHVGKFKKTPQNFTEYARSAMKRIETEFEISDEELHNVFHCFENRLDELNVFYLLRCKLAPVIETLILLDRLLFLKENGFENSHLVQLFDPVISPRCYGIVSMK